VSEIKSRFKALDPAQRSFVEDRRVSLSGPVDKWLELLGPVAEFDRYCGTVIAGRGHFLERRFAHKHRLPDELLELTDTLLPVLREDHNPDAPLELTIDFTGWDQKGKQVGESQPYQHGPYNQIVDTFFSDRWLEGRAQFADGADVRFALTDNVRHAKKRKRSASGKTKIKTKTKTKARIDVTVGFPARNYRADADGPAHQSSGKQKVKRGDSRTVVSLSQPLMPGNESEIEGLIVLLGQAYERVEPARRKKL
jgi:hypothetical protein